jgi:hypothetical protein
LVLDAFSSDSIPVHLLTQEAFAEYLRHLKPDGVLAAHISNVHLDLRPVIAGHAEHFALAMVRVYSAADDSTETRYADWVLLSRESRALQVGTVQQTPAPLPDHKLYWTDQRNSVFQVLRTWR